MGSRAEGIGGDVDLLQVLWQRWFEAGRNLPADSWALPGPGVWSVKELYAHVSRGARATVELLECDKASGPPDVSDAAAYFGRLMASHDPQSGVAAAAKEWSEARSSADLTMEFARATGSGLPLARRNGDRLLRTVAGSMRAGDYVLTRVVEATVHLLDLRDFAPGVSGPPERALMRTVDVLVALADPENVVRIATGRLSAAVFPVLR
ncbi:maleylpyruvate isomerase N-terminal domain-containing protein [Amycolatopsis sp. NPDC059090]|uniref:maleylpyruvate isomerase N-terminal domain-containing protein n=1 Tax=Amycolatopsis sp. NPDC059090 TaxID=3346723 RepID=UPI0036720B73